MIGSVLRCGAALVLLAAVSVGFLLSDLATQWGVPHKLEQASPPLLGMTPFLHRGTPFGFTFEQIPDLTGRTALVTGANTGLGYYTALHLARNGARTVLACRSASKCAAAADSIRANTSTADVSTVQLDLSSFASVRRCGEQLRRELPFLNIVVFNAGKGGGRLELTEDGIENVLQANYLGHFLLWKEIEDLVLASEQSPAGHATVTHVSSAAHYDSYPHGVGTNLSIVNSAESFSSSGTYGQSKLANVLFSHEMAARMQGRPVYANSLHPGLVQTSIFDALYRFLRETLPAGIGAPAAVLLETFITSSGWDAETAALTQLYTAVSPEIVSKDVRGKYFHPIAREHAPSHHAADLQLRRDLWSFAELVTARKQ